MTHQRQLIYQGYIVDLGLETVELPDHEPFQLEIMRHPGGAAVVAINAHHQVCLIRQYRHAAGGWIWEIPAGKIDPNEVPARTAERELQEEVGLQAQHWTELGEMLSSPGFCSEVIYLYLAQDLTEVGHNREIHELIETHWLDFQEALEWARNDTIRDAKTIAALFRCSAYLSQEY